MIKVSKEKWNNICSDYKGVWSKFYVEWNNLPKDYIGKKTVLSGCIEDKSGTTLLTEGIDFIIE